MIMKKVHKRAKVAKKTKKTRVAKKKSRHGGSRTITVTVNQVPTVQKVNQVIEEKKKTYNAFSGIARSLDQSKKHKQSVDRMQLNKSFKDDMKNPFKVLNTLRSWDKEGPIIYGLGDVLRRCILQSLPWKHDPKNNKRQEGISKHKRLFDFNILKDDKLFGCTGHFSTNQSLIGWKLLPSNDPVFTQIYDSYLDVQKGNLDNLAELSKLQTGRDVDMATLMFNLNRNFDVDEDLKSKQIEDKEDKKIRARAHARKQRHIQGKTPIMVFSEYPIVKANKKDYFFNDPIGSGNVLKDLLKEHGTFHDKNTDKEVRKRCEYLMHLSLPFGTFNVDTYNVGKMQKAPNGDNILHFAYYTYGAVIYYFFEVAWRKDSNGKYSLEFRSRGALPRLVSPESLNNLNNTSLIDSEHFSWERLLVANCTRFDNEFPVIVEMDNESFNQSNDMNYIFAKINQMTFDKKANGNSTLIFKNLNDLKSARDSVIQENIMKYSNEIKKFLEKEIKNITDGLKEELAAKEKLYETELVRKDIRILKHKIAFSEKLKEKIKDLTEDELVEKMKSLFDNYFDETSYMFSVCSSKIARREKIKGIKENTQTKGLLYHLVVSYDKDGKITMRKLKNPIIADTMRSINRGNKGSNCRLLGFGATKDVFDPQAFFNKKSKLHKKMKEEINDLEYSKRDEAKLENISKFLHTTTKRVYGQIHKLFQNKHLWNNTRPDKEEVTQILLNKTIENTPIEDIMATLSTLNTKDAIVNALTVQDRGAILKKLTHSLTKLKNVNTAPAAGGAKKKKALHKKKKTVHKKKSVHKKHH
jgi:hypothetical protein